MGSTSLTPDPSPDKVLGLEKCQFPKEFKHLFLDDDMILFKHRKYPDPARSTESDLPPLACTFCLVDQACAWALLVFFAIVSARLALTLVSSSSPPAITDPTAIGLVATFLIQIALYRVIRFSQVQAYDDNANKRPPRHTHLVVYLVSASGLTKWSGMIEEAIWKWANFRDFYDGRKRELGSPDPIGTNRLEEDSESMYYDGFLVVRLTRYPEPYAVTLISRAPWIGEWVNELYHIYKCHQRTYEAALIHYYAAREGYLADKTSSAYAKEYCIHELNKPGVLFFTIWPAGRGDEYESEEFQ